jgi:hypothetical protein
VTACSSNSSTAATAAAVLHTELHQRYSKQVVHSNLLNKHSDCCAHTVAVTAAAVIAVSVTAAAVTAVLAAAVTAAAAVAAVIAATLAVVQMQHFRALQCET